MFPMNTSQDKHGNEDVDVDVDKDVDRDGEVDQILCCYQAHLLRHLCQVKDSDGKKVKKYSLSANGFGYLAQWLVKMGQNASLVLITQVTKLLAYQL